MNEPNYNHVDTKWSNKQGNQCRITGFTYTVGIDDYCVHYKLKTERGICGLLSRDFYSQFEFYDEK